VRHSTFVGSSITTRCRDAHVHGHVLPVALIEPAELLLGASQADCASINLAFPTAAALTMIRRGGAVGAGVQGTGA
jgi:hypothetical protein